MSQVDRLTRTVRALRGGQITIPAEFRKQLGLQEDSLLQMTLEAGELRLRPVEVIERGQAALLKDLYASFAPVREEGAAKGYTEEEINVAIDEAVRDVRHKAHA
jgi:AbrB family looped-hinge helix DNA binding protein